MANKTQTLTSSKGNAQPLTKGLRGALYGLGTALCFSISPIFIRNGLKGMESPLLGVTIGMIVSTLAFGLALVFRRGKTSRVPIPRSAMLIQLAAGVLVGLSTWARWFALDLAPVGVVLALGRLNVPVVVFLSPILVGKQLEPVNWKVWLGAGLILAGSIVLALYG